MKTRWKVVQKYSYLLHWLCDDKRFKIRKINSVNSLYLVFSKMNEWFEEINRNKYLMLVPPNESKEKLKNMKNCRVTSVEI